MKLKVCGMKFKDNIKSVSTLKPDYMGFIFYDKSSRFFDGDIPELPKRIKKVGVFVDASVKEVVSNIKEYKLDAVQLHGLESVAYCNKLRKNQNNNLKQVEVDIIKVFSIKDTFNFSVLKPYEGTVDYFLFDTKGKLPGGNGYSFNWNVLENYPSTTPYFLSGGIGLDAVQKLKTFQKSPASKYCYAIDVNSKFETKPGLKKIEELVTFKNHLSFLTK